MKKKLLIVMDECNHEVRLFEPLHINIKQNKMVNIFSTEYNGKFNVTNSNNKLFFAKLITDKDGFIHITIPPGAYEIQSLNNETKMIFIDEEPFTETNYPLTIKPNFSTLGRITESSRQGPITTFPPDDFIRVLLSFTASTIFEEYNLSHKPFDFLSFDITFLECDIAQGMIFGGKPKKIIHKIAIDADPGYKYIEIFRGGVQCGI